MTDRFQYQWSERRVHFIEGTEDYEDTDDFDDDPICWTSTDLRGILSEMDGNCWDQVDWRDDGVICYPADAPMDIKTGDSVSKYLHIKANDRAIHWLGKVYDKN